MPAALWRQSQISLTTAEWQARFDLRLGDFIDDKPVAGCPYSLQSNEWFAGRLALPSIFLTALSRHVLFLTSNLIAAHVDRDEIVRIISTRQTMPREQKQYEEKS